MKCELFFAMTILPAGARIDLREGPHVCLDFARQMKERIEGDGERVTRVELNVMHRGQLYHWYWPPPWRDP